MTISSLTLHRYHHGELSAEERAQVRGLIDSDADVRARFQALLAAEADFAVQAVPDFIQTMQPNEPVRSAWSRWLAIGTPVLGLATVAVALFIVVGPFTLQPTEPEVPYVGLRGELPDLEVWVQRDEGPRVHQGQPLGDHDVVQLKFDAQGARHVTLAGRDSTGEIEIYRTIEQVDEVSGLQTAPFALTLDDTPGTQEFFLLVHDGALDALEIEDRIHGGGDDVRRVVIQKR
ncbi:MAG: hypothetical protein ACI9MC_001548 [Kiritimatiellia bacterium]|jgi:hypothetical protein